MIRAERHIETEKEVCGEITVFLSLILTCICALMGGLFESARAAGSGWYMQMALNSSLDSLMSCYHREIWDKYRIFVLECADKERLAAEMEPQMETYLAAAPFYPVSGGKVQIEAMDAITGHNGDFFAKEVTDYMKVGVWTLESEESELPEMEKRMTEARAVHGIAEGYQENGRKVLRLEESIEAIGACLQKQEKHLEEMEAAVRQADGSSFFQSAESLEKELKQIPGLVAAYEKQADRLAKELQGSEQGAQEAQPDLEEGSWGMVQEEMRGYRSYLDADGARRQEVKKTEETAHGNEEVVAEAVRKGKEIQDYIDDWEPDDEDDEQEYLLQGNASERENLKRTVNELLAVREAVNLAALYADSEKRSEAEALALAITGLAGITPITAAASFFIMTVWAFAESVADVKVLLAGGKIPFFKQPGEWQISLSALTEKGASIFLETGTDPSLKNGTDDRGLDYQDWLKLFFLIQGKSRFCYRMMDMIQNRISEKEPGFRMDQCQYGVSVSYAAQGTLIPLRRTSQKEY